MKNTRFLSSVILFVLLALVLAACGGGAPTAEDVEQQVEEAAQQVEEQVEAAATELGPTVEAAVEEAQEEVAEAATEIAPTLEAAAEEVQEQVEEAATEIAPTVAAVMGDDCQVKVGVILPYSGIAAAVAPSIETGIQYAFDTAGTDCEYEIIYEDETDDPTNAVAKARKLVEEDGVSVIIGPQLAHTAAAVSAYAAEAGIPHISLSAADGPESPHSFFLGSGIGDAIPSGEFAYDDLGARTAAVIYMDYLYGQQSKDGFVEGFTGKGGEIVSEQPVPFGTADMAPFLENVGDADVVAVLLVNPSDFAFVRQFREFGLEQPVIFISNAPQEAPLLMQMGDDVIGMYGASWYTPMIETPENGEFVGGYMEGAYIEKFGFPNSPPGIATHVAFMASQLFLEALKATGGNADPAAINEALAGITELANPAGTVTMGPGRVAIHDQYIQQVVPLGEGLYGWSVVKKVEDVEPK
jgi:branched-chain amino acid transport system substrate-binding protein